MSVVFQSPLFPPIAVSAVLILSICALLGTWFSLRVRHEMRVMNREMFGILKKIEGLTAERRERMTREYDALLEQLARRLPTAVAAGAGAAIFETESKILTRLAELEPQLTADGPGRERIEELIRSMERLEQTVVNIAADTVRRALEEARAALRTDGDDGERARFAA